MVNTFVPFPCILQCAKSLDYRRLGKQRVEAYQLWRALTGKTVGWRRHPAALAWEGCTCALALYTNIMIQEWIDRGYKNSMQFLPHCAKPSFPWWWGWEPIHTSHRASLVRKNPSHYTWETGPYANWGYIWPSKVPQHLRLVKDPPLDQVCAPISS